MLEGSSETQVIKTTSIINKLLGTLYFLGLTFSCMVGAQWLNEGTFYPLFNSEGTVSKDIELFGYPLFILVLTPIELFFAGITLCIYCCCSKPNKIAVRIFVWLTAIASIGPIVIHACSIPPTEPEKCAKYYNLTTTYYKHKVIGGCFVANTMNTAVLTFLVISHVILFVYLMITNYGLPRDPEQVPPESILMGEDTGLLYGQNSPQTTNINQFN